MDGKDLTAPQQKDLNNRVSFVNNWKITFSFQYYSAVVFNWIVLIKLANSIFFWACIVLYT